MNVIKFLFPLIMIFCSVSSSANTLDGGEIRFRGFITDDAPKWSWRIASPDQSWDVNIRDAQKERDHLVFDLKTVGSVPFLEGHLYEVAERGGPGFTPYITYSSGEQQLQSMDRGNTTRQRFRTSIAVRDPEKNRQIGKLEFTLEQGLAVAIGVQEEYASFRHGMYLIEGLSVSEVNPDKLSKELTNRISSLLMMNKRIGREITAVNDKMVLAQSMLFDGRVQNIAAAFASSLSDFKLYLPAEVTPARWHATLNVTVVVH